MKRAAVLWTGGKDSIRALQISLNLYDIGKPVCFVPADNRQFYARVVEAVNIATSPMKVLKRVY